MSYKPDTGEVKNEDNNQLSNQNQSTNIILNVSGNKIITTQQTLLKITYFNSILTRWQNNEDIFVDCDYELFNKFLHFVRFSLPINNMDLKVLCDYYGYPFGDYKKYKSLKVESGEKYNLKKLENIVIKFQFSSDSHTDIDMGITIKLNDALLDMNDNFEGFFKIKKINSLYYYKTSSKNYIVNSYTYIIREKFLNILNSHINLYENNELVITYEGIVKIFITFAE